MDAVRRAMMSTQTVLGGIGLAYIFGAVAYALWRDRNEYAKVAQETRADLEARAEEVRARAAAMREGEDNARTFMSDADIAARIGFADKG